MIDSTKPKPLITLTIPGRAMVLKNHKRIFGHGGKKRVLPSEKYMIWENQAMFSVVKQNKDKILIEREIIAVYSFYFENRSAEADVSNLIEGVQDIMVKAHLLKDDRLIMKLTAGKFFGYEPKTQVWLYSYDPDVAISI
jgi:Holliday junction resolvase RusA-like endonuclease